MLIDLGRPLWIVVTATLILPAMLAAIGFLLVVHPPRYISTRTPADLGWAFESVTLRTSDGLNLRGWYIPRNGSLEGSRAIIVLHGYPYDKSSVLSLTPFLHEAYDLLLFDFRYLGESDGAVTTVGHRERQDLLAAVQYVRSRGVQHIGVWGFSLGGAVALMGVPHVPDVGAVVADSAYADLHTMALDYYRALPLVNGLLALYTDILARLFLGVALGDVSPRRAVEGSRVPILLIHGDQDPTIPVGHFEQLRTALADNPDAELWLLEGVGHTLAYSTAPDAYRARVLAFFERHLSD